VLRLTDARVATKLDQASTLKGGCSFLYESNRKMGERTVSSASVEKAQSDVFCITNFVRIHTTMHLFWHRTTQGGLASFGRKGRALKHIERECVYMKSTVASPPLLCSHRCVLSLLGEIRSIMLPSSFLMKSCILFLPCKRRWGLGECRPFRHSVRPDSFYSSYLRYFVGNA